MSMYLSKFYCGNQDKLCNYSEPMDYGKITNRQHDNMLFEVLKSCEKKNGKTGYCCDPRNLEPMTEDDMKNINNSQKFKVFQQDSQGNIRQNQLPLINPEYVDDELKSMEYCGCGGDEKNYSKCIEENCKDFRKPNKYEYCKMSNISDTPLCVGNNVKNCKFDENAYMLSPNLKIDNLLPDCYLNKCNRNQFEHDLDQMVKFYPEQQYHKLSKLKYENEFINNSNNNLNDSIENILKIM